MAGRTWLRDEDVMRVMREVGRARLDDLAEHLGYHRVTVQRRADRLAADGQLEVVEGVRGPGGSEREYVCGDGGKEQNMPLAFIGSVS